MLHAAYEKTLRSTLQHITTHCSALLQVTARCTLSCCWSMLQHVAVQYAHKARISSSGGSQRQEATLLHAVMAVGKTMLISATKAERARSGVARWSMSAF